MGFCEAVVGAIEKRAGDRPVARVKVHVGRLHHVHPDAFEQSFAMVAGGGVADGAMAELVFVPASGHCGTCQGDFETDEVPLVCPTCGGVDIELTGGDELILESIEYRAVETKAKA